MTCKEFKEKIWLVLAADYRYLCENEENPIEFDVFVRRFRPQLLAHCYRLRRFNLDNFRFTAAPAAQTLGQC